MIRECLYIKIQRKKSLLPFKSQNGSIKRIKFTTKHPYLHKSINVKQSSMLKMALLLQLCNYSMQVPIRFVAKYAYFLKLWCMRCQSHMTCWIETNNSNRNVTLPF